MTKAEVIANGIRVSGVLANVQKITLLQDTNEWTNYTLYAVAVDSVGRQSDLQEVVFNERPAGGVVDV